MTRKTLLRASASSLRADFVSTLDRVTLVVAASVLAARPLYLHDPRRLAPSLVVALLSWVALVLWLIARVMEGEVRVRRLGLLPPLLLLFAAALGGIFTAEYRRPALATGLEWLSTVTVGFCLLQVVPDRLRARSILSMVLASALVVSLYAFHQYFVGLDRLRREYRRNPRELLWRYAGIEYGTWMQRRFEKRLAEQAAFSTFALPNTLAGYCAMLLPVAAGLVLAGVGALRRGGRASVAPVVVSFVLFFSLAGALFLTGSRGGWMAGTVGMCALALGVVWPRLGGRLRRFLPLVVLLVVLLVGLITWRVAVRGVEAVLGPSMRFRLDYWTGAAKLFLHHPLRGVGFCAFRDHYTRYKPPTSPEEVLHPHNLFLDLWSSMGLVGLVGFVWLLVEVLRGGGRGEGRPPSSPVGLPPRLPFPLILGGVVFWLLLYFLGLGGVEFCLVGGMGWLMGVVVLGLPGTSAAESVWAGRAPALGVLAGVLAFVAHSLIDLDVSVPAMVATLMGLLVFRAAGRGVEWRLGSGAGSVLLAVVTGVGVWFALMVVEPLIAGEGDYLAARSAEAEARRAEVQGDYSVAADRMRTAVWLYRRSLRRDPLNAEAAFALARLGFAAWRSAPASADPVRRRGLFQRAMADLQRVHRLRPRWGPAWRLAAEMHLAAAEGAPSSTERLRHLLAARAAADRLVRDIYPTNAEYRLLRARVLEALGEHQAARWEYGEVLRLDSLQRDPLLRLSPARRRAVEEAVRRLTVGGGPVGP